MYSTLLANNRDEVRGLNSPLFIHCPMNDSPLLLYLGTVRVDPSVPRLCAVLCCAVPFVPCHPGLAPRGQPYTSLGTHTLIYPSIHTYMHTYTFVLRVGPEPEPPPPRAHPRALPPRLTRGKKTNENKRNENKRETAKPIHAKSGQPAA